jgi:plasmid stabilization system protein ParE
MKREVAWTWAAEVDAQTVFMLLEDIAAGSGEKFVYTVERLLGVLLGFPGLAAMWKSPVRRAVIRRSHYGLFYVVESSRLVIIAVQDLRQDPTQLNQVVLRRLP